jgi:hypothetical protein
MWESQGVRQNPGSKDVLEFDSTDFSGFPENDAA